MILFRPIGLVGAGFVGANLAGLAFGFAIGEPVAAAIHCGGTLAGFVLMRAGMIRRAG